MDKHNLDWCECAKDICGAVAELRAENERLRASPASAPDYRIADRGFRWDAGTRQHIPQLLIEFAPVPANEPNDSKGWKDRDSLAAMLAAAPTPPVSEDRKDVEIEQLTLYKNLADEYGLSIFADLKEQAERIKELEAHILTFEYVVASQRKNITNLATEVVNQSAALELAIELLPKRIPNGFVSFGKYYSEQEDLFADPYNKMSKFKKEYLTRCEEALAAIDALRETS